MVDVSFIIPVYNVERYLRDSLDSVLSQTLINIEVICVNDGSTDGSAAILEEYAAKDSRIKIVAQKNAGPGAARNAGILLATGRYTIFFDSDDILSSDAAAKLIGEADLKSLDVLFFDADCFAAVPSATEHAKRYAEYYQRSCGYFEVSTGVELIAKMIKNSDYLCSPCFELWRSSFLKENDLRFTEGILHEDTEFTFKASLRAERAAHLHETFFHRRVRGTGSIMTNGVRFANSYGAFVAFLGMEQAYSQLKSPVVGSEWLLKEMEDVLFAARDRYTKLTFEERAKISEISNSHLKHLYRALVAAPMDRDFKPEAIVSNLKSDIRDTDKDVKISVIIPVYNMGRFVSECLDSVLGQTLKEIEVICVDDGSTDESPTILADFAKQDKRVHIITQRNQGVAAARNNALDIACGKFVIFMDPDDWYCDTDALRTLYSEAVANNVKICGGEIVEMLDRDTPKPLRVGYTPSYRYRRGGFIEFSEYQYFGWYTRFVFDRMMLEKNGIRFPPYLRYQDPPFLVKAMLAAGRFYALKRVFYAVRVEHKTIDWRVNGCRKLVDFMAGNTDIFRMARKYGLDRLAMRQTENLTSTGMFIEVLSNLEVPAVRNALAQMLDSMGVQACINVFSAVLSKTTAFRSQSLLKKLIHPKIIGIFNRTIDCWRNEGFLYTVKRMIVFGRK